MPQQLSLFEEPKHERLDSPLFFALLPDEEATLQIAQLVERFRQSHGLTGALHPLHITLCDLVPRETAQRTIEVACKVAAAFSATPFRVALNRVTRLGGKGGKRSLVLAGDDGAVALGQFRQRLCMQLRLADLTKMPRSFTPLLTLLHDDPLPPEQDVSPIAWTAQDFVLLRSPGGQSKPEVLGHWSLGT